MKFTSAASKGLRRSVLARGIGVSIVKRAGVSANGYFRCSSSSHCVEMFLCRSCRWRQTVSVLARNLGVRHESGQAQAGLKRSRLEDIIILDPPEATDAVSPLHRPDKPIPRTMKDASFRISRKKRKPVSQRTFEYLTTEKSRVEDDEVFKFLDDMKQKYQDCELTPIKYKQVVEHLRGAFNVRQLRAYLTHCNVSRRGGRSIPVASLILQDVWNTRERDFRGTTHQKSVSIAAPELYFLTTDNAKLLESWSKRHRLKLEINKSDKVLTMTGTSSRIISIEAALKRLMGRIASKTIDIDIPSGWTVDEKIMRTTNTLIVPSGPTQLKILHLTDGSSNPSSAERSVRISIGLHNRHGLTSLRLPEGAGVPHLLPIYNRGAPLAEQRHAWTREAFSASGVRLPSHHIYNRNPGPLRSHQVGNRPTVADLGYGSELTELQQLSRSIHSEKKTGSLTFTFGYCLQTKESEAVTFDTNIPGLFSVIKHCALEASEANGCRLHLTSPDDESTIILSIDSVADPALAITDALLAREHLRTFSGAQSFKLPTQPSDLRIERSEAYHIPPASKLPIFISQSDLRRGKIPRTLLLEDKIWNVSFVYASSLTLKFKDDRSDTIRLKWSKIRMPREGETRQELSLLGSSGLTADALAEAVFKVMEMLRKQ